MNIMKTSAKTMAMALAATAIMLAGCRGKQEISTSYSMYKFKTTCVGANGDGTQTLRAWGTGASIDKAIEQAKKNAVSDVIFKGIPGGKGCNQNAIVTEVNARERYEEYFDRFFADGGEYAEFVYETSNKDGSRVKSKDSSRENYGVVVTVNRSALRDHLRRDGVIK